MASTPKFQAANPAHLPPTTPEKSSSGGEDDLISSLRLLDPILQFLTRATGRPLAPLRTVRSVLPGGGAAGAAALGRAPELARRGILSVRRIDTGGGCDEDECGSAVSPGEWARALRAALGAEDGGIAVGFPAPPGHFGRGDVIEDGVAGGGADDGAAAMGMVPPAAAASGLSLHGSTKAAAKRRMAALKKSLKMEPLCGHGDQSKAKHIVGTNVNQPKPGVNANSCDKIWKRGKHKGQVTCSEVAAAKQAAAGRQTVEMHKKGRESKIQASSKSGISCTKPSPSKSEMTKHPNCDSIVGGASKYTGNHLSNHCDARTGNDEQACRALESLHHMCSSWGRESLKGSRDEHLYEVKGAEISDEHLAGDDVVVRTMKKDSLSVECSVQSSHFILPQQVSYAGSQPGRERQLGSLPNDIRKRIPGELADALGLDLSGNPAGSIKTNRRHLYSHQAQAVEAVMRDKHTIVCTGTGSGKSLCFLLPVLADVMTSDIAAAENAASKAPRDLSFEPGDDETTDNSRGNTALIMFPTKALARDQLSKLQTLAESNPTLRRHIRPGVIDGDTPHQERTVISGHSNIILTNPDTLHAALLPGWKKYRNLLARVKYAVIDEAHTYDGAFGGHVSLVLSRLVRVCAVAFFHSSNTLPGCRKKLTPTFIACSATMGHPEEHFRLLCPISQQEEVCVLNPDDDGSPTAPKHFFVWNPPILENGNSTGRVVVPRPTQINGNSGNNEKLLQRRHKKRKIAIVQNDRKAMASDSASCDGQRFPVHRRHSADETARILAEAVKNNVRCIAFCKTRSLVEWVYERCISNLKADPEATHFASRVESYRGGYTAEARRSIERRLFHNEIIGVVGTSALELGVDIGGIDLTLHCGYPGSISSLLQQSGRAGRGGRTDAPSFSITICFSSPSEQHLWRHPKGLLSRGLDAPPSVHLNAGIVQGHMLCGGDEYPLTGSHSILSLLNINDGVSFPVDHVLFGSEDVYNEALNKLLERGLLCSNTVTDPSAKDKNIGSDWITVCRTHPSVDKPWTQVSIRSIEPISYAIVDTSHPLQGGRTDGVHDKAAIMDTIPYSRVFYHAYPGAVIMHRGKKYKVHSMNSPPPFADCTIGYQPSCTTLGAFAKPTMARYSTRALSMTLITVVKQFDRVELVPKGRTPQSKPDRRGNCGFDLAGNDNVDKKSTVPMKRAENANANICKEKAANNQNIPYESPELNFGSIAGNGVVTVKRTVHGYKKLSPVNRVELGRAELTMPPMEFDTNAFWLDAEADLLRPVMNDYDAGVHALAHAILAVAPLFVPCTSSDIDCDHSRFGCTKVLLFDVRAGGAGTSAQLWKHFFCPDGIMEAALSLLEHCPTCSDDSRYNGGCPGCLQSSSCSNFNESLSRSAGLCIGKRMLARLQQSDLYMKSNMEVSSVNGVNLLKRATAPSTPERSKPTCSTTKTLPRCLARTKALHNAKDLVSARNRNILVGRPTWPMDNARSDGKLRIDNDAVQHEAGTSITGGVTLQSSS